VTLQAILDCAQASFDHYDTNRDVWMTVRNHCKYLLGADDLIWYRELFDKDGDKNRHSEWVVLLEKCYLDNEDIRSSDYKGQANLRNDIENISKDMWERVLAYHQLKAFSVYFKDKPAESETCHRFLVSNIFFYVFIYYCCDNNLTPLFCRCTSVVRLLQIGRLGIHWGLRRRGNSGRTQR